MSTINIDGYDVNVSARPIAVGKKFAIKVTFESLERLAHDYELDIEKVYILSRWDCNNYIHFLDGQWVVKECHGSALESGSEYLLIEPKF
jgi:hypothetical protein